MAATPGVWGIDIGQCALKAIRLEMVNGQVTATAFDYVEHAKILSQPDANPDELTREALEKFLSRNPVKGDQVAMSVPGQSGLARFVKLPPVEEKKILDIVRFEAKQQIPFPLDEVVWDYQKVSEGMVEGGFAIDTEIGLFAMKRDMIARFIGHFQSVNVEVHHVQMAPLALCNFITYDLLKRGGPDGETAPPPAVGKKKCVVALDVGTDSSNLIITDGGRIIWQRPIPLGGNHFTRALTKELKLTFAKAEHLKRNAAKSPELPNILRALKPVLGDFVGEVQRSLGYFTNTHRDAQVEYMVGLGSAFRLPGLQKYLADKLSLDVRKPAKFEPHGRRVGGRRAGVRRERAELPRGLRLGPAGAGRGPAGDQPAAPRDHVRPQDPGQEAVGRGLGRHAPVRHRRAGLGDAGPLADANDPSIQDAIKVGEEAKKNAEDVARQIVEKKKVVDERQKQVEAIIAGTFERENWLELNRFVNLSLPVPDQFDVRGAVIKKGNIADPRIWNTGTARRAADKYRERLAQGTSPFAGPSSDDLRQDLPMIEVQAVYQRWTPDLKGVYERAEKLIKEFVTSDPFTGKELAPEDWDPKKQGTAEAPVITKPEGKGWVVEVRGTTYFQRGNDYTAKNFLVDTIVANLVRLGHGKEATNPPLAAAITGKVDDKPENVFRVSHVFLYNAFADYSPQGAAYKYIDASLIDNLVSDSGASAGSGGARKRLAVPPSARQAAGRARRAAPVRRGRPPVRPTGFHSRRPAARRLLPAPVPARPSVPAPRGRPAGRRATTPTPGRGTNRLRGPPSSGRASSSSSSSSGRSRPLPTNSSRPRNWKRRPRPAAPDPPAVPRRASRPRPLGPRPATESEPRRRPPRTPTTRATEPRTWRSSTRKRSKSTTSGSCCRWWSSG